VSTTKLADAPPVPAAPVKTTGTEPPASEASSPASEASSPAAAKPTKTEPARPTSAKVPRSAIELRAARRRVLQRRFGLWVGLPTLLAIIYYVFVATPQYDAWVVLAVESNEGHLQSDKGTAGNQRDARLLRESLHGTRALAALDRDGAFRSHYKKGGDWLTRLAKDAAADTTLAYFRDKVEVAQEAGTNLLTVRVRAFSGDAAFDFATRLVEHARTWVSQQNEHSSAARLQAAQAEVSRERASLAAAAKTIAELPEPPKATDPAAIERQVAEKRLEVALGGLQEAMLEVGRTERYLVVLDGPSHPEVAAVPRRAWSIASVGVCALVVVSVLSLLGAAVREHAKF